MAGEYVIGNTYWLAAKQYQKAKQVYIGKEMKMVVQFCSRN